MISSLRGELKLVFFDELSYKFDGLEPEIIVFSVLQLNLLINAAHYHIPPWFRF